MGHSKLDSSAIGRGVYGAAEALRLINFRATELSRPESSVSRQTVARWLRGYEFVVKGEPRQSSPLWRPDYANDDDLVELSFRDLIELRFVKAFRDAGVSLQTVRECFNRAVEEVHDTRPFSTSRFRTDGRTIFLEITRGVDDQALVDLRQRQQVFRAFVAPSIKELEFDADQVARWFPLGGLRRSVLVDPAFAFGRPISSDGHVPTEVLAHAAEIEGSAEKAARAYDVPISAVRAATLFESRLAA